MRTFGVVKASPLFNQDLGFEQCVEDLAVEEFVSHPAVERFDVSVLPWTAGCDERGFDVQFVKPIHEMLGNELWTIVTTDMLWSAMPSEKVSQDIKHVYSSDSTRCVTCQGFVREFIDDVERSELSSITGLISDEVIAPDVVLPLGTQAHNRPVRQEQPCSLGLL